MTHHNCIKDQENKLFWVSSDKNLNCSTLVELVRDMLPETMNYLSNGSNRCRVGKHAKKI